MSERKFLNTNAEVWKKKRIIRTLILNTLFLAFGFSYNSCFKLFIHLPSTI